MQFVRFVLQEIDIFNKSSSPCSLPSWTFGAKFNYWIKWLIRMDGKKGRQYSTNIIKWTNTRSLSFVLFFFFIHCSNFLLASYGFIFLSGIFILSVVIPVSTSLCYGCFFFWIQVIHSSWYWWNEVWYERHKTTLKTHKFIPLRCGNANISHSSLVHQFIFCWFFLSKYKTSFFSCGPTWVNASW